ARPIANVVVEAGLPKGTHHAVCTVLLSANERKELFCQNLELRLFTREDLCAGNCDYRIRHRSLLPAKSGAPLFLRFVGADHYVAMFAHTLANAADARGTRQFEMDDAAIAGRHRLEAKRLVSLAHSLRRHTRGK